MILVDSSVWVDYFRGVAARETDRLDELLGHETLIIGDLILTEVLQGFVREKDFNQARKLLSSLIQITIGGFDVAVHAARNHRALRKRGVSIRKTIDILIATRCIQDGYTLLHRDRDFHPFVSYLGLRSVFDNGRSQH